MNNSLNAIKLPTDTLSYTDKVYISEDESILPKDVQYAEVVQEGGRFTLVWNIGRTNLVKRGHIAFGYFQRRWGDIAVDRPCRLRVFLPDMKKEIISTLTVEVRFLLPKDATTKPIKTEILSQSLLELFNQHYFHRNQEFVVQYEDSRSLLMVISKLENVDAAALVQNKKGVKEATSGVLTGNSLILFQSSSTPMVMLIGNNKASNKNIQPIINPDWNFQKMGIGGLDEEFNAIFRRAFASRVFPPDIITQLGMKHVKGILLFGPPGTGKTLMARQIGQMLNAKEPKIVNGPEILDKYVGESESKIRNLFADAEEEEKKKGPNSGLHIIIFDEIDAICKQRGSVSGSSGVNDTVVNQLLSKIDGVRQLNNILVIGMTNRKDMIDEALIRPGRLEVQVEINLPDEKGRLQILNIHTKQMSECGMLGSDVDLKLLAGKTRNFSGAEIEGLVRAAQSTAMNRQVKASDNLKIDQEAINNFNVTMADFNHALENDVKAAFGCEALELEERISYGILKWNENVNHILEEGRARVKQVLNSSITPLVSILLYGAPNSGKTAIASKIALETKFPFLKFCSTEKMIGFTESAKCLQLKKTFDDAYKSKQSCIVLDDIESLMDYASIGPRFSNLVLQTLKTLLRKQPVKGKKLFIIATSTDTKFLRELGLTAAFSHMIHVHSLNEVDHIINVLKERSDVFTRNDLATIQRKLTSKRLFIGIKSLIDLLEAVKQSPPEMRVDKFLDGMEEGEFFLK
ncbi:hypothetical protein SNEBB_010863 [Seison nebaliae]|nr:hypothetical protein SNEBB_010863 [Seison nebaliae]